MSNQVFRNSLEKYSDPIVLTFTKRWGGTASPWAAGTGPITDVTIKVDLQKKIATMTVGDAFLASASSPPSPTSINFETVINSIAIPLIDQHFVVPFNSNGDLLGLSIFTINTSGVVFSQPLTDALAFLVNGQQATTVIYKLD